MNETVLTILIAYLLLVNVIAFFMYGIDKRKAQKGKWRTPEAALIGIAVIGGSVGALLGMKVFRHKTKHPKFVIGVPVILLLQLILAGVLYLTLQ